MTKLLEIRDKAIKFYGEYSTYVFPVVKFVFALVTFLLINANIGYMTKISNPLIAVILALICALLPVNGTILVAAIVVLLDMYALSLEVAAVTAAVFLVIYFVYFRFAPKDGIVALLTPICFALKIPYAMPIGVGLIRKAYSFVAIICGTVVYFLIDGIKLNAAALTDNPAEAGQLSTKLNVGVGQVLGNKEMIMMIILLTLTTLVVYFVKRIRMDHAWTLAVVVGIVVQLLAGFITLLFLGTASKALWLIIGVILSGIIGFICEFIFMNLDYKRTERVQFEDDEYYYYVKAIPKKMVPTETKTVRHYGDTSSMGKRIPRQNKDDVPVNSKDIAQELNIDEDLLK